MLWVLNLLFSPDLLKKIDFKTESVLSPGSAKKFLIIVCSSDRGLCGGIHSSMSKFTRKLTKATLASQSGQAEASDAVQIVSFDLSESLSSLISCSNAAGVNLVRAECGLCLL